MVTIIDPNQTIQSIWRSKKIDTLARYRLMKYVEIVDEGDRCGLYNVVTGQLVKISADEKIILDNLPGAYTPEMDELIKLHYLVEENYDEHVQVKSIRTIVNLIQKPKKADSSINHYTILPTTTCNARCYYCVEQGVEYCTMTKETALDVVQFIADHYDGNGVYLNWYGGEPTVAHKRISEICTGLQEKGIVFSSTMISNGYLFDENLAETAKQLWNLTSVRISMDGCGDYYNKVKNYVHACDNPYEKVMHNIGFLLRKEISVDVRMNFDMDNIDQFKMLTNDLLVKYGKNSMLKLYVSPVYGEYENSDGILHHGAKDWLQKKHIQLNDWSKGKGLLQSYYVLPSVSCTGCGAFNDSYLVINPKGHLSRCLQKFENEDAVGSIYDGITNNELYESWTEINDNDMCVECVYYPLCIKNRNCPGFNDCFHTYRNHQYRDVIQKLLHT